jgi:hypothetical protein
MRILIASAWGTLWVHNRACGSCRSVSADFHLQLLTPTPGKRLVILSRKAKDLREAIPGAGSRAATN